MISLKRLRELPFSIKNGGSTSVFHLFKHKKQIENIVVFSKKIPLSKNPHNTETSQPIHIANQWADFYKVRALTERNLG